MKMYVTYRKWKNTISFPPPALPATNRKIVIFWWFIWNIKNKDTRIRFNDLSEFNTLCKCNQSRTHTIYRNAIQSFLCEIQNSYIQWMNYLNNQETFFLLLFFSRFVSLVLRFGIWVLVVWVSGFWEKKIPHFTDWELIL